MLLVMFPLEASSDFKDDSNHTRVEFYSSRVVGLLFSSSCFDVVVVVVLIGI